MSPRQHHVPWLVSLLAVLAAPGCSGNESDDQESEELDSGSVDSGHSPGQDASQPPLDAQSPTPDASEPDAGQPDASEPDASEPDAEGPTLDGISLTLRIGASDPVPNATVLLYDAAGAKLDTLLTDQNGQIHSALAPHAVTVLPPSDNLDLVRGALTYVGVKDGDDLIVQLREPDQILPTLGSFELTVPPLANASTYVFYARNSSCSGSSNNTTFTQDITAACRADSMDLVVAGIVNGTTGGYAVLRNQAPPTLGNVATLTYQGTWAAPATFPVTVDNVPNDLVPNITVAPFVDGQAVYTGYNLNENPQHTWNYLYPDAVVNQFDVEVGFSVPDLNDNVYSEFRQRTADTSALAYDASDRLAPVRISAFDDSDPKRPLVTLTSDPQAADVTLFTFDAAFTTNDGQGQSYYGYGLVVAPGAESFQFPDLSDVATHFADEVDESVPPEFSNWRSRVYDGNNVADYNALRQQPIYFDFGEGVAMEPIRTRPSRWRITTWTPPGT
ncbi:MAG: hypothetical protein QM778_25445 [Myxococcales bacterium]